MAEEGSCGDRKRKRNEVEDEEASRRAFFFLSSALSFLAAHVNSKAPTFRDLLDLIGRQRRDRRIPREALLWPEESPWKKLCNSGNQQAMITATGFDHQAFAELLSIFKPLFNGHTPWTGLSDGSAFAKLKKKRLGRPRLIAAEDCLGLVLCWCRFKGALFILQGWFGLTGTPADVWLKFGRRMLLKAIHRHPHAKVRMPSDQKIEQHKAVIGSQHPALANVHCVADGLKLFFESVQNHLEQSMCHNGWTGGCCTTNLFCFGPDGRIIACFLNSPGSVHDSTMADWGDVYKLWEEICDRTGAVCCIDSAFKTCEAPCLIRSSNDETKARDAAEHQIFVQATSLRQAAEWGMRAIQGSFPRLKDKIKCELNGERKVFLLLAVCLYNCRVERVGLNQIRNVCVPGWSKDFSHLIDRDT